MIPQAIDKLVSDYNADFAKRFPVLVAYAARGRVEREARETFAKPVQREGVGDRTRKIARILSRDGDDCCYCGKPLGDDMTLEHRIARSKGGSDDLNNLKLAHRLCNQEVGNLPPDMKDELARRTKGDPA